MYRLAFLCTFVIALSAGLPAPHAARDVVSTPTAGRQLEMVVLEIKNCIYCNVFRQRILPAYQASRQARRMPVRFVDINDPALADIGLTQPISVVPTFIVLEDNEEIGRIPGLVGHNEFFRALDHITGGDLAF